MISDPAIVAELQSNPTLIDGNATAAQNVVDTADSQAYAAVYDGSNSHAQTLNTQIAALNNARSSITG